MTTPIAVKIPITAPVLAKKLHDRGSDNENALALPPIHPFGDPEFEDWIANVVDVDVCGSSSVDVEV